MQMIYDGTFSLLIGDFNSNGQYDRSLFKDTWTDWHLVPVTKPVIDPPPVQTNSVEIPGMNGVIDMTEVLLGYPLYSNRTGSLEFYVDTTVDGWDFETAYDSLLNLLHGKRKKLFLNSDVYVERQTTVRDPAPTQSDIEEIYSEVVAEADDPILHPELVNNQNARAAFISARANQILNERFPYKTERVHNTGQSYYYEGRLSVNSFRSDRVIAKIVIDYELDPFKKTVFSTTEDWLWNPFDFVDGVIPEKDWFVGTLPSGTETPIITLTRDVAGIMPQIPTVKMAASSAGMSTISKENSGQTGILVQYKDSDGENAEKFLDFWDYASEVTTVGTSIFVDPSLVIGDQGRGDLKYKFINNLKDENNNDVLCGYLFDFRPGRL